ncbi:MAG: hypothetical protein ACFFFC_13885 [Candidatus Thorarchaeota archaeon]
MIANSRVMMSTIMRSTSVGTAIDVASVVAPFEVVGLLGSGQIATSSI